MRRSTLGVLVGAVAAAGLLAGCTSSDGATPRTGTATVGSASSAVQPSAATGSVPASSASPTPDTTSSARVDPNAPAGQCSDSALQVFVQADGQLSGAGQAGSFVVFRNEGARSCVLRGAPGVSLVGDHDGTQIGAAAARESGGAPVRIAPGSYAAALLTYPNIDEHGGAYGDASGHDPQCGARPVDGYRVYPPHSFRAAFRSAEHLYGCSTDLQALRVGTVQPASKYPYFTPNP